MNEFIKLFAEQFDDLDPITLTPESKFRDIEGWSSLMALSIIAMVDEEFEVILKGDDIRGANTISDLYSIILRYKK